MNYEIVTLDEISEKIDYGLTTSATSSDTGVKFLRITDIQENGVDWQSVPFCECSEKDLKQYSLARGDIVFARTGATTGKSFLIKDTPEKTVFASYLIRVRSNQKLVDPDFLSCFFQTPQYWQQISDSAVGAAQVGVNGSKLAELKLPLPPLTEQKRIASLLRRADRLRQLRRTAHDLGDALLQSVFLEMFGDPETNPKNWDLDDFEKTILSTQNGFGQRSDYSPNGMIVLRIRDISSGKIDLSDPRRMIIPEKELAKYALEPQDLIIVRVNGNPNYVGIASEFTAQDEPIVFSDHVIRIKMDKKKLNTTFVVYLLNSPYGRKQTLGNISTTAGQFTINSSGLSRIKMIYPPLSLQEEFAGVVRRVESLRGRMGESERQVEGLFESLLAESFGGG